jgi:hypothetical protein
VVDARTARAQGPRPRGVLQAAAEARTGQGRSGLSQAAVLGLARAGPKGNPDARARTPEAHPKAALGRGQGTTDLP